MDRFTIRAVDDVHQLGLDRDAAAMLMIESDLPGRRRGRRAGPRRGGLRRRRRDARRSGPRPRPRPTCCARPGARAHWALEKLGDVKMEDVGVPRSRVPGHAPGGRAHRRRSTTCGSGRSGTPATATSTRTSSSSAGDPRAEAITKAVQADLYQAALDLGGTVTGEHGIGSARREWMVQQRGADAVRVMRAIKTALDPQGLLNPGRVLPDA